MLYKSEGEARKRIKEEQEKLDLGKLENRGLNCPKCGSWILHKGDKTVCKCGWKMKP